MSDTQIIAKAALINEKGEVLVLRRSQTDVVRPGDYDFPGGKADGNEGNDEALLREIKEEAGLELSSADIKLLYARTGFRDNLNNLVFFYVGKVKGHPDITLSYEHDKYWWMSVQETLEKFQHPVWREALQYGVDHDLI